MTPPFGLTPRQAQLLDFITSYQAEHGGTSPSFREMAEGIGLASKAGVQRMVEALAERGHLRRLPGRARSIVVLARAA